MNSRTIEIVVSPQGEARLETRGFTGSTCRDASQFLARALGVVSHEQLTSEFYQPVASDQRIDQGQQS
jgi:hypothetical protein